MKIHTERAEEIKFQTLERGDVFSYEGKTYMKCYQTAGGPNTVGLFKGVLSILTADVVVTRLNAVLEVRTK